MISVEDRSGRLILRGAAEAGGGLYVDADWAAELEPGVALATVTGPSEQEARAVLAAHAKRIAAEVAGLPGERVEVRGTGAVANAVRGLIGAGPAPAGGKREKPVAIVSMRGSRSSFEDAAKDLDDGGLLVLAGERAEARISVNLYPDVHLRGLRVVGAPPLMAGISTEAPPEPGSGIAEPCGEIGEGDEIPAGGWFRIRESA